MYGHPSAVVEHARALAPSAGAFWRWFKGASQMPLPFHDAECGAGFPSCSASTTATNSQKWDFRA